MENYKGIYYNDEKEPKLYEGGAHFKYNKLYKILLSLGGVLEDDDFNHSSIKYKKKEHIKSNKDINSLLIKVKAKKSKYKTIYRMEDISMRNNEKRVSVNVTLIVSKYKSLKYRLSFCFEKNLNYPTKVGFDSNFFLKVLVGEKNCLPNNFTINYKLY